MVGWCRICRYGFSWLRCRTAWQAQAGGEAGEEVKRVSPGEQAGLEVVLDQHSDRWLHLIRHLTTTRVSAGTLFPPTSGFRVFLGQPAEFPVLQQRHFTLRTGRRHSVELGATQISTDTSSDALLDMRSLEPATRGCRFTWESEQLTFYSSYSLASCRWCPRPWPDCPGLSV